MYCQQCLLHEFYHSFVSNAGLQQGSTVTCIKPHMGALLTSRSYKMLPQQPDNYAIKH
jgi:hypothetical protein